MYDFLRLLADATPAAPPDNSVKIALITAISVVLAAAITAITTTLSRGKDKDKKEPNPVARDPRLDLVDAILRRAETAEHRNARLEADLKRAADQLDDVRDNYRQIVRDLTTLSRTATSEREQLVDKVDELEATCWRNGIDPGTGQRIVPGGSSGYTPQTTG